MKDPTYRRFVDTEAGIISREIFTSRTVHEEELERVFTRGWLFVGHESQIRRPGDFFVSRMGAESVILCRDRQGTVHVFLNTCRHRGMKVCLYDEGNTSVFTCPYHKWSYSNDGKLYGVPQYPNLYEGNLDREQWSLIEVPKLALYKGTVWATWDASAPEFLDYLGDAKRHLDLALDSLDGREGGSEVFGGIQKWIIPCNWKFAAENFLGDTYHNPSHISVDMIGIGPSAGKGAKGRRDDELKGAEHVWINFPQGHGVHSAVQPGDLPYTEAYKDNPAVESYFRHCYEERKRRLGEQSRLLPFVGTIFPNGSYNGRQPRSISVWHPHGPDSTEVWRFFLVDQDAPAEVRDLLRHFYMRYQGPAGMTEQDDMENWNYATAASRGPIARRYPYNYQQSLRASSVGGPLPGRVSRQVSEDNPRAFYRRWCDYMDGRDWDTLMGRDDPNYRPAAAA